MSPTGAIRIIVFAIGAGLMIVPALAHSPYFTQTEKLALADGQVGTIRLLHGDGIILSDPMRAVIFDEQGRMIARSSWSWAMLVACDREHRCRIYDFDRMLHHEPDPGAFRIEPSFDLASEHFSFSKNYEGHGFAVRRMTVSDRVLGYVAYVSQNRLASALALAVSSFASMLILVWRYSARQKTAIGPALYYTSVAFGLILIAPLLALVTLAILVFAGMPILLWLLLSAGGAIVAGAVFWWAKRRQIIAAQAA